MGDNTPLRRGARTTMGSSAAATTGSGGLTRAIERNRPGPGEPRSSVARNKIAARPTRLDPFKVTGTGNLVLSKMTVTKKNWNPKRPCLVTAQVFIDGSFLTHEGYPRPWFEYGLVYRDPTGVTAPEEGYDNPDPLGPDYEVAVLARDVQARNPQGENTSWIFRHGYPWVYCRLVADPIYGSHTIRIITRTIRID